MSMECELLLLFLITETENLTLHENDTYLETDVHAPVENASRRLFTKDKGSLINVIFCFAMVTRKLCWLLVFRTI